EFFKRQKIRYHTRVKSKRGPGVSHHCPDPAISVDRVERIRHFPVYGESPGKSASSRWHVTSHHFPLLVCPRRGNEKLSNKQHECAMLSLRLRLRLLVLVLVPAYKRGEDADGGKGRARDERGMETCQERVLESVDSAGGKVLSL